MASFSRSLDEALHRAIALATEREHELATLEHLLLALTEDRDAAAVMRACNVDVDELRRNLHEFIENELTNLKLENGEQAKPTASFQRVIQRAVIHVQSSGREEVTGANVLVALFAERESNAAHFLQAQDMTRFDAVNYISHGLAKRPGEAQPRAPRGVNDEADQPGGKQESALEAYCVDLNTKARTGKIDPLIGRDAEVERAIQVLCPAAQEQPTAGRRSRRWQNGHR